MKRRVFLTFMVIFLLAAGAASYHDYPYFSIIDWTSAGVVLTGSVLNWIYRWRKHRKTLKE